MSEIVQPPFDRRLTPARPDLAAEHLAGAVTAARYVTAQPMAVVDPLVDMRPRPDATARLDTQLLAGERIAVYEQSGGWAWGQAMSDGYVGYLPLAALAPPGPAATHRVASRAAHVYPDPDLKAPVGVRLPWPAQLSVSAIADGFARLAEGGYVPEGQIAPLEHCAEDWVAEAEALLGTPYLWGGRSGDGIDCSALVQLALATAGIAFPRDSDMQAAHREGLEEIAPGAPLRRGDLVFWPGHVGIMRDGAALLHANAHHMATASEPLSIAAARIEAKGEGTILSILRPRHASMEG